MTTSSKMVTTTPAAIVITTEAAAPPALPSYDETICNLVAANIYDNIQKYVGTVPAIPFHTTIVLLLILRVSKHRFYHFLIMAQCIVDVLDLSFVFVTHSLCVVFKKLLDNWLLNKSGPVQLILNIYLVLYWKATIRPQRFLDIFFHIISVIAVLLTIADHVFRLYNDKATEISLLFMGSNILGNITLCAVCFNIYFLVRNMDVSYFSEVTLKGQKKMTTALLFEFILILINNIFDIFLSYANYEIINDPAAAAMSEAYQYVTDQDELDLIRQEFLKNRSIFFDVLEYLPYVTSLWSVFLPLLRGLLIFWAIRPLLQKRTVIVISRSITDQQPKSTSDTQRSRY